MAKGEALFKLLQKGLDAGADYIPDAIETPLRRVFNTNTPSMAVKPKVKPKSSPPRATQPRPAPKKVAAPSLDMGTKARMARAREMGFDVDNPLYVSTLGDVAAFNPHGEFRGHKGISGISLTDNPELASRYLDRYGEIDYKGEPFSKQMMKVLIRPGEIEGFDAPVPSQYTLGAPLPEGYAWPSALENVDTAIFPDAVPRKGAIRHLEPGTQNAVEGLEYILRDPTRVRSFTAAFDPQYFDDPDLMKARGGLAVKPVWDKKRPKDLGKPKDLSAKKKKSAKARAKAAGRPYPNLVDNMAAARKKGK